MSRPADQIFLRIAVQRGCLTREQAEAVQRELKQRASRGDVTKARHLCVQVGMLSTEDARTIKHEVRAYLEKKANQESRPQRRIAGFEIESRLGCGAMGVVFKARHLGLNKTVALKLLNPEFANDPKYVARFLQEARAAARLSHPGIVQAYDVGQADEVHFIAMEFVRGKTVKELIERRGKLSEAAAIEIVIQVLDALRHAHEQSVIHRDVKPANIMITREGQAKLLDLGLARQTDVENGLTGEGRAIGTPYYMAPEQALDKGADYRADLYSLGVTLFNMLTGRKPYEGSTPVAVMNMHIKAAVPDVRNHTPELSEGVSRIIAKLMAKRPADRYQDHADLKADMQAVLAGAVPKLETGETPEGIDYIKPRPRVVEGGKDAEAAAPRRRTPWFVAAAAAGVLVGGGLIAFLTHGGGEAPAQVAVSEGAQQKLNERDATAALQDLDRIGSTGRTRAESLLAIAERFPGTEAAGLAAQEADALLRQLDGADAERFRTQQERLEGLAAEGKLLDARRGFQALAGSFEGVELAEKARDRASELQGTIQQQVAALEQQALNLTRHGDLAGAGRVLERSLALRDPADRAQVRQRIASLLERGGGEHEAGEEAVAIANLPKRLRGLVREGRPADALTLARELLATTREPSLHERVAGHVEALEAILDEPESPRGVAALKLYRGDRDAAVALSKVRPLGSLAGVSVELEALDRGGAPVQAMHASNASLAVTTYASMARDEQVADQLPRLFPAATSSRFLAGAVALNYEFYPGSGFDHDWRVVDGKLAAEEVGLCVRGEGRAEFDAPLEGEVSVSLRFSAPATEGRLALTLDAGDQRFSSELGKLRHTRGGDLRQEVGRSVSPRLRDTRSHLLELTREGQQLVSRFDGEEIARLDLPMGVGAVRLGFEWADADFEVETLEVRGVPNGEWVERRLR